MKKSRGKALALVLSLALLVASFPVTFASAASKTVSGTLTDDPTNDEFWLVNGGTDEDARSVFSFQNDVYSTTDGVPLETKEHEPADDIKVSSISHVSGDRVAKWDIDDDTGEVTLSLRNSDSEGDEVLAILYKGTWTDEDDNDYTVRASTKVTVHAVDLNQTVIGDNAIDSSDNYALNDDSVPAELEGTEAPEVGDFATKVIASSTTNETTVAKDSKTLTVFRAVPVNNTNNAYAKWEALKTVAEGDNIPADAVYTLKSSNSKIALANKGAGAAADLVLSSGGTDDDPTAAATSATSVTFTNPVTAASGTYALTYSVDYATAGTTDVRNATATSGTAVTLTPALDDGAVVTVKAEDDDSTTESVYVYYEAGSVPNGSVTATATANSKTSLTFTAEPTDLAGTTGYEVADDEEDIKAKTEIVKKVKVNNSAYRQIKDDGDTYITGTGVSAVNIDGGYEVNYATAPSDDVTISDKAKIAKLSGDLGAQKVTIGEADVDVIDLDGGEVVINDEDADVGDIETTGDVTLSSDTSVGSIDADTGDVKIEAGSTGDITTSGAVDISADEEETAVSVGDVKADGKVTVTTDDGSVSIASLKAGSGSSEFELSGDNITLKALDFDYRIATLTLNDFQGELPSPANATEEDATIETTNEDDDVTFASDVAVDSLSLQDESKVVFGGKADIGSLDGSGTVYIGANKLYISNEASSTLIKLTDSTLTAGETVFTAASDAVDEDDLDFYGFTVAKDEGKTTDTFKVDKLALAGLAANKTSTKIVLGQSETLTASAYAPGTALPEGYSIKWDIEDNSGVFDLVDNENGTATIKVIDYDETFADENKATAVAYLADEDGDEDEDYERAEVDLTALKVPEIKSDTTTDISLAPGASYTYKITSATAPNFGPGTGGVVSVSNVGYSGNDYFIKVTAIGKVGSATGIYVNGTKINVVTIKANFTSDTTQDVTVKKGASYTYKITAPVAPAFGIGTGGVFTHKLTAQNGNDYYYQITATGAAGARAGIYVNGQKVNVATVG